MSMKKHINSIINDDCNEILKNRNIFPDKSIDLIMTSPPYAGKRGKKYPTIKVEDYVDWFSEISLELYRILKPRGSFILNIKEGVKDYERQTYVLELVLQLKKQGWMWTEEYCWNKQNSFPGSWPNRFRDGWERCFHFTKQRDIKIYKEKVKVPIGSWAKNRINKINIASNYKKHNSATGSGFNRRVSNWDGKKKVHPDNVLSFSTVSTNLNHSAAYPIELPQWFIKLLTLKNNIVLDPFMGSGTTALAALSLNRRYIGIEILTEYVKLTSDRINVYKEQGTKI